MSEPRFPLVIVDVPAERADEAAGALFELGAGGVEERDATTLVKGAPGKVTLVASFTDDGQAQAARGKLPAEWAPRLDAIVGDAWRDDWKKYFRPFAVCPGVVVRPPWEAYEAKPGEHVLVLEPGRAFGTGLHETTSLVAEVLAGLGDELTGATILDVGCGSGILSMVGLVLGARSARAIDVDPDAVLVTRENAARNGLADRLRADPHTLTGLGERYPLVVANIEAHVLVRMADALGATVAPSGLLVLSGLLANDVVAGQTDQVRDAYPAFTLVETKRKGEWTALLLRAAAEAS